MPLSMRWRRKGLARAPRFAAPQRRHRIKAKRIVAAMRQIRRLPEGAASPANSHSRPVVPMSGHHRSANRASGRFCTYNGLDDLGWRIGGD